MISCSRCANALPIRGCFSPKTVFRQLVSDSGRDPTAPPFDEEAYERDRLQRDAEAMKEMEKESQQQFSNMRNPWKWKIRHRIWDMMESTNIARFPRPVHHRIPNFVGAEKAAANLADLPEFRAAHVIKVNPDTPQRPVRHQVLQHQKVLLTPQPRLRTGFFSIIDMRNLPPNVRVEECTNSPGVQKYGTPVTLHDQSYKVDMVVSGCTAVCPRTGARIGKGEGFAELEWGILSEMGNLDAATTVVVTTVHDAQVVDDIPADSLTKHDVPVDIIVTPTRVIRIPQHAKSPKPSGIFWDLLSPQKLQQIRVLRICKAERQKRAGAALLPTGPDEVLPPAAKKGKLGRRDRTNPRDPRQWQALTTTSPAENEEK